MQSQANSTTPRLPVASHANWTRFGIGCIEDLQQAVLGANLSAHQFSRGTTTGSLAFIADGSVTFSSGYIRGKVNLVGPLSETQITLGVGVHMAPGTRHWLREVESGGIGVFMPNDEHDALYASGSIYAAATLSADALEEIAADHGVVLDAKQLGGSGISKRRVGQAVKTKLQAAFAQIHLGRTTNSQVGVGIGRLMLEAMIEMLAREPRAIPPHNNRAGYARIVARAQDYILHHLDEPLSISGIARAAYASQSTLYRAFHEVLDETPQTYVRKMRLNRIRHDLATPSEAACSITVLANKWGISELGRLAGLYRETFGELPSKTQRQNLNVSEAVRQTPNLKRFA